MPKIRTHKGTQKRFETTGTGILRRRKAFQRHLLAHKSAKRKRVYATKHELASADVQRISRLAPYL